MDVVCGMYGYGKWSSAWDEQTKRNLAQQGWPSQAAIDGMVLKNYGPTGFFREAEGTVSQHLLALK